MILFLIIMILTAWNDLSPQVPLYYGIDNQSMVGVSKYYALFPLIVGLVIYIGLGWFKRQAFLNKHIHGRDTLTKLAMRENWIFKLSICQSDGLIFCVLLELSMIAKINIVIALSLVLIMTTLVLVLQYQSYKKLKATI